MEKVEELAKTCCQIVMKCPNVGVDDAEFTQGVLSMYHLFTHFLNLENSYYNIGLLLLKTTSTCLQLKNNHLKDVESIVANLFSKVWNLSSDKLEDHEMSSFRQAALALLIHLGSRLFWNRTIDKIFAINQEPSSTSCHLSEAAFDALVTYYENHSEDIHEIVPYLLQIWTQLVQLSTSPNQHKDHTSKLAALALLTKEPKQIK